MQDAEYRTMLYRKERRSKENDKVIALEKEVQELKKRIWTMNDCSRFNEEIIEEWIAIWNKKWLEHIEMNFVFFDDDLYERIEKWQTKQTKE